MTKNRSKSAAAAQALAPLAAKMLSDAGRSQQSKNKKKKKKNSFLSFLSGAAKIAAEIAPVVTPLLLSKHGPSRSAMATSGSPVASSVGIASPLAIQPQTGLTGIQPIMVNGRVSGVRLRGIDFLGQIAVADADGVGTGSVLAQVSLNPSSPDWFGTRLQRELSLWERFRFTRFALLYEPALPTTQPGQMVMFIDTDADETIDNTGLAAVQQATAHAGSEMFQVWEAGTAEYLPDNVTQDFYADSEGSDQRLISPGNAFLLASTDLEQAVYGALYGCYEVELLVPQIEDSVLAVQSVSWIGDSPTALAQSPFGDEPRRVAGALVSDYFLNDGAASSFFSLPPGDYNVAMVITGSFTGPFAIDYAGAYTESYPPAYGITSGAVETLTAFFGVNVAPASRSEWSTSDYGWFACTLNTVVTTVVPLVAQVWIFRAPTALAKSRRRTLQDFEKTVDSLTARLARMESASRLAIEAASVPLSSASLPDRSKKRQ